jgi:hypothetical protein
MEACKLKVIRHKLSDCRMLGLFPAELWGIACAQKAGYSNELNKNRQCSFNWQSTAFVMRGLWVRLPPLAFASRADNRPSPTLIE